MIPNPGTARRYGIRQPAPAEHAKARPLRYPPLDITTLLNLMIEQNERLMNPPTVPACLAGASALAVTERFATGGIVSRRDLNDDTVLALISPGSEPPA